jgi:hypothetical protein
MSEIYYRVPAEELDEIYRFHYKDAADKRTRYAWEWEYGKMNPRNSLLLAVKYEGNVIATQGMMSIKVSFSDQAYNTGKNESLLIDKAHRGKSLSTRFYKYAISEYGKEGISCIWGFSSKAIIPLSKANFRIYKNIMTRMILSLNYRQAYNLIPERTMRGYRKLIVKPMVFAATIYSKVFYRLIKRKRPEPCDGFELSYDLKNHDDLVNYYKRITSVYPELIFIYQDYEYFDWRIKKAPSPVKTLFLYKNDELNGYFYLTVNEKYCELTDFTFLDAESGSMLIKELISLIRQNNFGFIYYTGNSANNLNRNVLSLLASHGFIKMRGPSHFVLRNYTFSDEERLFKIENWYLNELWSEGN